MNNRIIDMIQYTQTCMTCFRIIIVNKVITKHKSPSTKGTQFNHHRFASWLTAVLYAVSVLYLVVNIPAKIQICTVKPI